MLSVTCRCRRDAWYNITVKNGYLCKESDYYYSKAMQGSILEQKLEAFDSLEKNSVDFYATVRSLYIQDRQKKLKTQK